VYNYAKENVREKGMWWAVVKSPYTSVDTPALLIDNDIMEKNLAWMQAKADMYGVDLRPHIKTHKMPELARLQIERGAKGITVAKLGEAEVMVGQGISDVFIANQIVGAEKIRRLGALAESARISLGVDNVMQVDQLAEVFSALGKTVEVLIEVEVGERRCGLSDTGSILHLARHIGAANGVRLKGVFCHEGHTYGAKDAAECVRLAEESQEVVVGAAKALWEEGMPIDVISIGATPAMLLAPIHPEVTEIRPGTYIFMDVGQAGVTGDFSRCAASVLSSVISKPTTSRVVFDAGAKALTMQRREGGICHTVGFGALKACPEVRLSRLFDEHAILEDHNFSAQVALGDKIEIVPNHICPTVNLYDSIYLVAQGQVIRKITVLCRGKII
jgi:D-serine deaminase-like pyridoxal phosphate-dependent protein